MSIVQSRRRFLTNAAFAGAAGLGGFGLWGEAVAAEPSLETTTLRIKEFNITCGAPQIVAEELLYAEGFTDVRIIKFPSETNLYPPEDLLAGETDISMSFAPTDIARIDEGAPIVILAGSHAGCFEVFARHQVKSVSDLKGKTVGVSERRSDQEIFVSMFAAYVGLDPQKDINWAVFGSNEEAVRLLTEGKIDAFQTAPPWSMELRKNRNFHVLVNATTDMPWSQYFCCLIASTKEFVGKHPIATKRALRALLKAADVCAAEPERVARLIADRAQGLPHYDYATRYRYALRTLQEFPYREWRELDPEDTLRFYSLRMREAGFIKSTPQKMVADGSDWRFLDELKRELKA
jgi:NitT/TauT family transport system substrate-binding protein